ncbi:MAG: hypothetical protein IPJ51_02105 [Saprospiraceae bacterium]|nr:hypothetical protein [Saprospiraceae bacterium]
MVDFFEHIDEYIKDQLSPEDKQAFEAEMTVNPTLRSAVDNYDLLKEISMGFLETEVREILNQTNDAPKKPNNYRWIWVTTIIVLLIAFAYYLISSNGKKESVQYADLYIDPAWPIDRSESTDTLSDAIKIALNGNTSSAVMMIKKTSLPNDEKNIWIAEIFAKSGQADSTLLYLPPTSDDNMKRDRINYLKVISLYSLGKKEDVKKLIDALPENTDGRYKNIYLRIN